jgi:23S rRNA pseudouridine955/2504/2580 synthase
MALEMLASENDDNRRLDRVLRKALDTLALSAIHRLLRTGKVRINGEKASGGFRVRAGDTITVEGGETMPDSPARGRGEGRAAGGLPILYEGGGLLILNKPAGIPVHGKNSLDTRVKAYLETKLPPSLSFSPGPLHRLDIPTSGILVFSTSLNGAREFTRLLREGKLKKYYLAVAQGEMSGPETWEDSLVRDRKTRKSAVIPRGADSGREKTAAKTAVTLVRPLMAGGGRSLLLLEIRTGRTHQIRSQAAFRGRPLWGDTKYGGTRLGGGILLHAALLVFPEQDGRSGFPRYCLAPPPRRFLESVELLFHCPKDKSAELLFSDILRMSGITEYIEKQE